MLLPDHEIERRILDDEQGSLDISPLDLASIQPASYDVRLGSEMLRWCGDWVNPEIDQSQQWRTLPLGDDGTWLLFPGGFYLGVTLESIYVPDDLLCHLHGRSSLGRLGIQIHTTAGLIDPGYTGKPTLEIIVQAGPTRLKPGMPIGQLTFHQLTSPAERPYQGRYWDDVEPTPSRLWRRV